MHARCRDCIEEHAEKPVDKMLQQSSLPTPSWLLKEGDSSAVSLRGPRNHWMRFIHRKQVALQPCSRGRQRDAEATLETRARRVAGLVRDSPHDDPKFVLLLGVGNSSPFIPGVGNALSDKVGHGIERRSGLHLNSLAFKVVNKTGQLCRSPQIRDAAPVLLLEGGRDDTRSVGS